MNNIDNYDTLRRQTTGERRIQVKDIFLEGDIVIVFRSATSRELKAYHMYTGKDVPDFCKKQLKTLMHTASLAMDGSTVSFPTLADKLDSHKDKQYQERVEKAAWDAISVLDFMDETIYNICERAADNFEECINQFVKTAVTGDFIGGFSREDYKKYVVKDDTK